MTGARQQWSEGPANSAAKLFDANTNEPGNHPSDGVAFAADLPISFRSEVEKLFFFNPQQGVRIDGIRHAIARAGLPSLLIQRDRVSIGVPSGELQCLFACSAPSMLPLGVALYGRPDSSTLWIAHLAVAPGADSDGTRKTPTDWLVGRIIALAAMIRGIERIELPYQPSRYLCIKRPRATG